MINPTISSLLAGVATSLDETVLPDLPPGFARNQLAAAISLIRRCATVDESIGPYLWDDNHDVAAVLSEIAPIVGLDPPTSGGAGDYPTLDGLRRQNLALQKQLVAVQEALRGAPYDAPPRVALRTLYERMLARESQINVSSWV